MNPHTDSVHMINAEGRTTVRKRGSARLMVNPHRLFICNDCSFSTRVTGRVETAQLCSNHEPLAVECKFMTERVIPADFTEVSRFSLSLILSFCSSNLWESLRTYIASHYISLVEDCESLESGNLENSNNSPQ